MHKVIKWNHILSLRNEAWLNRADAQYTTMYQLPKIHELVSQIMNEIKEHEDEIARIAEDKTHVGNKRRAELEKLLKEKHERIVVLDKQKEEIAGANKNRRQRARILEDRADWMGENY